MPCRYHIHKTSEPCYGLNLTPEELGKKTNLDVTREKTQRDSYAAVIDASVGEVKCIDWEQRRMQGSNAMPENTRRKWVGFTRMGELPSLPNGLNNGFELHCELNKRGTGIFRTTQTDGAVDEFVPKTPSCPPPPSSVTSVSTVVPSQHTETLPPYQAKADRQINITEPAASCTNTDVVTPVSSVWSRPDSELRHSLETALEYGKRSACPGTFPESREGSLKSVTP
jgi:hypothetical protein